MQYALTQRSWFYIQIEIKSRKEIEKGVIQRNKGKDRIKREKEKDIKLYVQGEKRKIKE